VREPTRTILHLVGCTTLGGTERQVVHLVGALRDQGVRSLVAYLRPGNGELAAELAALGVAATPLGVRGSLLGPALLPPLARLVRLCRRERVAVIHAHDYAANLLGAVAACAARVPLVVSRRDLADWRPRGERRLLALACRAADRVLVNAATVAEVAVADGVPPERVRLVANGIDLAAFDRAAAAAPEPAVGVPGPHLVTVASMERAWKGHGDLLEAAALLRARGRRASFLLVSDGRLRPALEARATAMGGADAGRFLGRRRDVAALLARADAVIHPSWSEGFPNAVLEAMAASRPVIATRVGACPDLIRDGETGWLVPPRSPPALAAAIERLLDDLPRARAVGLAARRAVEARYSASRLGTASARLYAELVAAPITD
jgi:L-malate glycosyltransferase